MYTFSEYTLSENRRKLITALIQSIDCSESFNRHKIERNREREISRGQNYDVGRDFLGALSRDIIFRPKNRVTRRKRKNKYCDCLDEREGAPFFFFAIPDCRKSFAKPPAALAAISVYNEKYAGKVIFAITGRVGIKSDPRAKLVADKCRSRCVQQRVPVFSAYRSPPIAPRIWIFPATPDRVQSRDAKIANAYRSRLSRQYLRDNVTAYVRVRPR